ncbi:hypothetical protein ACFSTC_46175 [Nonomuraea ferruginea]
MLPPGEQTSLFVVMAGGMLTFLGVLILGPVLVRPLSAVLGWVPAKLFGVPGRLAVDNSGRNPKRAATTTVALTIGVTLMTLISVVTASTRATVTDKLDEQFPVDYALMTQGREGGIPRSVGEELKDRPEFAAVLRVRDTAATVGGVRVRVGTYEGPISPKLVSGALPELAAGQVAVAARAARDLRVGGSATRYGSARAPGRCRWRWWRSWTTSRRCRRSPWPRGSSRSCSATSRTAGC